MQPEPPEDHGADDHEEPPTGGDGYSLTELTDLTGVSQRTVRYYIQQGLLPSASRAGPGARYAEDTLLRLRFIRACQEDGWPLAKVRDQLERQPPAAIAAMLTGLGQAGGGGVPRDAGGDTLLPVAEPNAAMTYLARLRGPQRADAPRPAPQRPVARASPQPVVTRATWERLTIDANLELHVRRPLSLAENRRLDRLLEAIEAIYGPAST
jgi:DNA-binding transcriptional MerR regulator